MHRRSVMAQKAPQHQGDVAVVGDFVGHRGQWSTLPSAARDKVRATVPKLIDLTEKVLFGDVWERPQLSKRDRSLVTCAALVALNRTEQLKGHLERALNNGVTPEEIGELITHLAFYGGWPVAMSGALVAKDVLEQHMK
jgi:4-carboxymuconolactone decarboxylase